MHIADLDSIPRIISILSPEHRQEWPLSTEPVVSPGHHQEWFQNPTIEKSGGRGEDLDYCPQLMALSLPARHSEVFKMVRCNDRESQEAGNSQNRQKLEADKSARKPEERERSTLGLKLRERTKTKWPFAAKPREKQAEPVEPNATEALVGQSLTTCPSRAEQSQPPTRSPTVVFLKTSQHRTSIGDMKKQAAESQWLWYSGLPTRIHLPGPRVMCRSSRWRWINRCCTRSCSIELPMYHPYRVGQGHVRPESEGRAGHPEPREEWGGALAVLGHLTEAQKSFRGGKH